MRINHIKISNLLGIEFLDVDTKGKFTLVSGDNAAGKTSFIEAIRAALGGGNRQELIRVGAEKAEVVLEFDTGEIQTTTIKPDKTTRTIKSGEYRVPGVQAWISKRLNPNGFNPIAFVQASQEQLAEMLLKIVPVSLEPKQLEEAVGDPKWLPEGCDNGSAYFMNDPLDLIDMARGEIYRQRTDLNASNKSLRAHAEELEKTIPPDLADAPDTSEMSDKLKKLRAEAKTKTDAIEREKEQETALAKTQANDDESAARAEFAAKLAAINDRKVSRIEAANKKNVDEYTLVQKEYTPQIEDLVGQISKYRQISASYAQSRQTIVVIDGTIKKADASEADAKKATEAINRLDDLRSKLLEVLPVKGLEVVDGDVKYQGVPYQTLNTAMKVDIACRLAAACSGELKLICFDGLEALGARMRKQFIDWASESDAQFFVTRVVDDLPLTLESKDPS